MDPQLTPTSDRAADLVERGFDHHFALDEESVVDLTDDRHYVPEQVEIVETYRDEGLTDPDDEVMLMALRAPDRTRGTLTVAYGPDADHADVLRRLGTAFQ